MVCVGERFTVNHGENNSIDFNITVTTSQKTIQTFMRLQKNKVGVDVGGSKSFKYIHSPRIIRRVNERGVHEGTEIIKG